MAADGNFTNVASGSKVPPFEELNFKKFKKFFTSFLMRHNRAHLVLSKDKPRHIHDLDSTVPAGAHMTDAQKKRLGKAKKLWNTRNETAYSFLMEVCNAHPKAGKTAALSTKEVQQKGYYRHWKRDFSMLKRIQYRQRSQSSIQ